MEKEIPSNFKELVWMPTHPFGTTVPAFITVSWGAWIVAGLALAYLTYELKE